MPLVHLVIALALVEFFLFGLTVSRARGTYGVPAPATGGNEMFERYFRVQMNTLEQLVIFVPGMLMFGRYVNAFAAAILGAVFIVGRIIYFASYVKDPRRRGLGFALSALPNLVLLGGAIAGTLRDTLVR